MPTTSRALDIDDLMGDFATPPSAAAETDLDALLDMLAPAAKSSPSAALATDLDALLDDLAEEPLPSPPADEFDSLFADMAAPPTAIPTDLDFDDLLGEIAPPALVQPPAHAPTHAATPAPTLRAADVELDDLLGELAEPEPAPPKPKIAARTAPPEGIDDAPAISRAASPAAATEALPAAVPNAPVQKPAKRKRLTLPSMPSFLRGRAVLATGLGALLLVSNGLSYTLGAHSHPAPPPAPQAEHPAAPPATGILRYVGEGLDFRIDEKTIFEDDEFRAAVDELVGAPEVQGRIAAMLPTVHALEPVSRTGARLRIRACNPQSCGQENFLVIYDTANKRVSACITQPYVDAMTGEPTRASSWLYDEQGSREVPACEGFPHPAPAPTPPSATNAEASTIAEEASSLLHHAHQGEEPAEATPDTE